MRKFCVICGRAEEELVAGMCRSCYIEKKVRVSLGKGNAKVCRECGAVFNRGWNRFRGSFEESLEEAALSFVERNLSIEGLEGAEVGVELLEITQTSPKDFTARVLAHIHHPWVEFEEELSVKIKLELCDSCQRSKSKYYEAIVQLRGGGKRARELLESAIDRASDPLAFISKVEERKEGVDYYIGSVKAARKAAQRVIKELGGFVKEAAKLYGRDKSGKEVYRVTLSVRIPSFRQGDVLRLKDELYQVVSISSGTATLFNLADRSTRSVKLSTLEGSKIAARREDAFSAVVVEKKAELMLLDLKEYKTFYAPLLNVEVGAELKAVNIDGVYYVLKTEGEE